MLSERPFRENTKTRLWERCLSLLNWNHSRQLLMNWKMSWIFFETFSANPDQLTVNPIFGYLSFAENVHLLHKHAMHHLKQFSIID